jgi:hypothetical protein
MVHTRGVLKCSAEVTDERHKSGGAFGRGKKRRDGEWGSRRSKVNKEGGHTDGKKTTEIKLEWSRLCTRLPIGSGGVTDRNGLGGGEGRIVRRPKGSERGPAAPPLVYGLKGGSAGERVVPANQSRAVGLG